MKKDFKFDPRGITYDEFVQDASIKVIAFEYLVPRPIFPPIKRVSRFYLYRDGEPLNARSKYNVFNLLMGWIGLPFGPGAVASALKKNKTGVDFTIDFRENINKADYDKGIVSFKKLEETIIKIEKRDLKEFKKAFKKYAKEDRGLSGVAYTGLKIDEGQPIFVIGLSTQDYGQKDKILEYLYKYFYKHVKFCFVDMDSEDSLKSKLIKYGEIIVDN